MCIPGKGKPKDLLDAIGKKFKKSFSAAITNFMDSFMNTKYDKVGGIRNFILRKFRLLLG